MIGEAELARRARYGDTRSSGDLPRELAPLDDATIAAIKRHVTDIVEIGAGDGSWARGLREHGLNVIAYDISPRGEGVISGSHLDAAKAGDVLLAVWPPEDLIVTWLTCRPWKHVIVCGKFGRFPEAFDVALAHGYSLLEQMETPPGCKGVNHLRILSANSSA